MADTEYSVVYDPALDRFVIPTQLSKMAAVYLITNTVSGHSYVGSSKTVGRRISIHLNGKPRNRPIAYDLACYGRGSFCVSILEIVDDETLLDERETYWIGKLKPSNNTIRSGSHGRHAFTPEARMKISAANAARRHSEETKAKIGRAFGGIVPDRKGCRHTEDAKKKISDTLKNTSAARREHQQAILSWMFAIMSYCAK